MSVRSHRAVRLGVSAALMTSFSANAHVRTASRAKPTLRLSGKYWPAIVSLDPYFSLIWPAKMGQKLPLNALPVVRSQANAKTIPILYVLFPNSIRTAHAFYRRQTICK